MIVQLFAGAVLFAVTVAMHAAGLTAVLRWGARSPALLNTRFWPRTWLLIRIACCLLAIHLIEITVWALFYWRQECFPDAESALYFSGVTYSSVGYGDLLLPKAWRLLGPIQGLTGILMCGLSIGVLFAVVNRMYTQSANANDTSGH